MVVGFRGWQGRGRGMVVGFRGWPAPVHHDDPQQEEHHHKSSSLLYPCIAYISANNRDIDTKLSGCVQIPKEHSVPHSGPQHQQQLHHHHHHHRHLHQTTSLLDPCIPYISVTFFERKKTNPYILAKNKDNDTKLSGYDPWGLPRSSMLSRMTLSSKSPIRNPQRPPRGFLTPIFLTHFQ